MCCQDTPDCLCTLPDVLSSYARRHVWCWEHFCSKVTVCWSMKCSPHRLRSAPPGGSWARGCAPPHTNTSPWHPYKDNKNRQCHGSFFFFFYGIRVGLIRGICGRRCRVCTAPSNRNRLGRGGIFKKQRPGSDPETTWKQKCALDLIVRGQNKQLENRRVWQMM